MAANPTALRGLLIILSKEILGAELHEADAVHAALGIDRDQSCALFEAWANNDLVELWRLGELYSDGALTLANVLAEQAQAAYTTHARLDACIARGADAAAQMSRTALLDALDRGATQDELEAMEDGGDDDPWGDVPPAPAPSQGSCPDCGHPINPPVSGQANEGPF